MPSDLRHLEPDFSVRAALLEEALWFTREARKLDGVRRIALFGSLASAKVKPKDCDFLITVSAEMELAPLAALGRKLKGHTASFGSGADVFLCDELGSYLGRICEWKECWPRLGCDALHCGARPHLHDDLQVVTLSQEILTDPPVLLWPGVLTKIEVPGDVQTLLLEPLAGDAAQPRRPNQVVVGKARIRRVG